MVLIYAGLAKALLTFAAGFGWVCDSGAEQTYCKVRVFELGEKFILVYFEKISQENVVADISFYPGKRVFLHVEVSRSLLNHIFA